MEDLQSHSGLFTRKYKMKNNFEVLTDWDLTLFNTAEFADDLWGLIADLSGVNKEIVAVDGANFHSDPILGGYAFEDHVRKYDLPLELAWSSLKKMHQDKDYLYDDSEEFIDNLVNRGYQPKILSFGEYHFQEAKIVPYLDRLHGIDFSVVMERKSQHISNNYRGSRGVLIDDVPDQKLPEGFTEIFFNPSGKASDIKSANQYVINSLHQAVNIIDDLNRAS